MNLLRKNLGILFIIVIFCVVVTVLMWTRVTDTERLTAFSTVFVGLAGFAIATGQFAISRHKKDDFLYETRFKFYERVVDLVERFLKDYRSGMHNVIEASKESKFAENAARKKISFDFADGVMIDVLVLGRRERVLFNDEKIQKFIRDLSEKIKSVLSNESPDERSKDFKALWELICPENKELENLFSKYLRF